MSGGLWVADLESGQRQRLLPDFQMQHYTISADGQRVVFVAADDAGRTPVWLARSEWPFRAAAAHRMDSWMAYFGAPARVVFEGRRRRKFFIYRVKEDGSELAEDDPDANSPRCAVSRRTGNGCRRRTPAQYGASWVYPAGRRFSHT